MSAGLPSHLSALLSPQAFPHAVARIQLVETHISWVLLTGEFAYKIKRPVHYPFVDLRSQERRAFLCEEEVRLNRRFAPDLYVEVCPITSSGGEARIAGTGEVIEHAVRMRQFRREDELDRLLAAGAVTLEELTAFGRDLARVHESFAPVGHTEPYGSAEFVRASLLENVEQCIQVGERVGLAGAARELKPAMSAHLDAADALVTLRRDRGRVRECHGDLHSRNVVRHAGRLVAFDCMEFEPAFRWIDVAEEIAFLFMDLDARGATAHATAFLNGYLAQSGDYHACRLVRLYAAHRALVRAKVAALELAAASLASARDAALAEHDRYVDCARRMLGARRPALILMSGLSGSGKTWLAERLAPRLGAIHVRSDVERKRMAGLGELARSGSMLSQGLYSADMNARLYQRLADCAGDALAGGFTVIVDATFQRRADRSAFAALASRLQVPMTVVRCQAPKRVLESRITDRARVAADASEADLAVLDWQCAHYEPIGAEEGIEVVEADTTQADVVTQVQGRLTSCR